MGKLFNNSIVYIAVICLGGGLLQSCEDGVDVGAASSLKTTDNNLTKSLGICQYRKMYRLGRVNQLSGEVSGMAWIPGTPAGKKNKIVLLYDDAKGVDYKQTPAELAFIAKLDAENAATSSKKYLYGLYAAEINRFKYPDGAISSMTEEELAKIKDPTSSIDRMVYMQIKGIPSCVGDLEDVETIATFKKDGKSYILFADTQRVVIAELPTYEVIEAALQDTKELAYSKALTINYVAGAKWEVSENLRGAAKEIVQIAIRAFYLDPGNGASLLGGGGPDVTMTNNSTVGASSATGATKHGDVSNAGLADQARFLAPTAGFKFTLGDVFNAKCGDAPIKLVYQGDLPSYVPLALMSKDGGGTGAVAALAGGKADKKKIYSTKGLSLLDEKGKLLRDFAGKMLGYTGASDEAIHTMGKIFDSVGSGNFQSIFDNAEAFTNAAKSVPTEAFISLMKDANVNSEHPLFFLGVSGVNKSPNGAFTLITTFGGFLYGRINTLHLVKGPEDSLKYFSADAKWLIGLYPKALTNVGGGDGKHAEIVQMEDGIFMQGDGLALNMATTFDEGDNALFVSEIRPNTIAGLEKYVTDSLNKYGFLNAYRIDKDPDVGPPKPEDQQEFRTFLYTSECVDRNHATLWEPNEE